MIVRKDRTFNKLDLYPNTDWIGDADWVIDDSTQQELEEKIIGLYPDFDFIFDDDGNIADIAAAEPVTAETLPEPPTNAELAAAIAELAGVICGG